MRHNVKLLGHTASVEDVKFMPNSENVLCSAGQDSLLLFWDIRVGSNPVITVKDLHDGDINTVDWSVLNDNFLATGANDCLVKLLDIRKIVDQLSSSPSNTSPIVATLQGHPTKVQTVRFSTFDSRFLASTGEQIVFWNLESLSPEMSKQASSIFNPEEIKSDLF